MDLPWHKEQDDMSRGNIMWFCATKLGTEFLGRASPAVALYHHCQYGKTERATELIPVTFDLCSRPESFVQLWIPPEVWGWKLPGSGNAEIGPVEPGRSRMSLWSSSKINTFFFFSFFSPYFPSHPTENRESALREASWTLMRYFLLEIQI